MNKRQMKKLYNQIFGANPKNITGDQFLERLFDKYHQDLKSYLDDNLNIIPNKDCSVSISFDFPKGWKSWSISKKVRRICTVCK